MATILVVDDYRVQIRMYSYTLRRHGHTVLTAENGQAALEHLDTAHIDLLITDTTMPILDGLTLLRRLRADERYQTLPVILITASEQEEETLAAAEDIAANAYLTRPISSRDLIETVMTLLGGRIIGSRV
jgi:CheY-like chemotaxis protein